MKVLLCDTDPEKNNSYNLEEIFTEIGISPLEIVEIRVEEAERRIAKGEKFDLLIASYDFHKMDSYEVVELIKKIGTPSIFLDYHAHMGVSRYVRNRTVAICVYKDEARHFLSKVIKRILERQK